MSSLNPEYEVYSLSPFFTIVGQKYRNIKLIFYDDFCAGGLSDIFCMTDLRNFPRMCHRENDKNSPDLECHFLYDGSSELSEDVSTGGEEEIDTWLGSVICIEHSGTEIRESNPRLSIKRAVGIEP